MTDYWSKEEGAVFDANSYILPCKCVGTVYEGSCVTISTTEDMSLHVAQTAAMGDAIGVACRAGATGSIIPVLFYGVYKMTHCYNATAGLTNMGSFVMGCGYLGHVISNYGTTTAAGGLRAIIVTGGSYILGLALQDVAADGDEFLVLVGKCI